MGGLVPGAVLDGRYKITRELGHGAMGLVFVAEHLSLGRDVAIKTLRPELTSESDLVRRFEQEARAASAIGHPGIVHVFDLGRTPEGAMYMAMELLAGRSLREVLDQEGALAPTRAVDLAIRVLEALGAAHKAGIVHRDLKPENVFVLDGDVIKLLDFGIAKAMPKLAAGVASGKGTTVGIVMGTPAYMSPEQARGDTDQIDPRTDVYATGVVLYEMLSARPPYQGENIYAVLSAVLDGAHSRLAAVRPGVPAAVVAVVERAMARDRDARYADAEAMRAALVGARDARAPAVEDALELPDEPSPTWEMPARIELVSLDETADAPAAASPPPPEPARPRHTPDASVPPPFGVPADAFRPPQPDEVGVLELRATPRVSKPQRAVGPAPGVASVASRGPGVGAVIAIVVVVALAVAGWVLFGDTVKGWLR